MSSSEFSKKINRNQSTTVGISIIIGLVAGFMVVLYRFAISYAEKLCFFIYENTKNNPTNIVILFVSLAVLGFGIGLLIKKFKMIGGSGIPQVKGILLGYFQDNWFSTFVAKFFGGIACTIAGLSLGREGPSIQLGACMGQAVGDKLAKSEHEKKIYMAAGSSAGLSAAFNAPIAGVMFCLEELFRYISPLILLATLTSAVAADFISVNFFGTDTIFHFTVIERLPTNQYWILPVLGIILGFSGVIYNKVIVLSKRLYGKIKIIEVRPIIPFLVSGIMGLFFPIVLCGGHSITEELSVSMTISALALILLVKFLFSMISFSSGTPGGIFFPLLIIGALLGAIFGKVLIDLGFIPEQYFFNFVILGMAGYFTAIVRAPITGIILLLEMTGSFMQLLPLSIVCLVAYFVANLTGNKPVYDSLLEIQIGNRTKEGAKQVAVSVMIETIVQYGSVIENKKIKDLELPQGCLIVSIKRGDEEIIPRGVTTILGNDVLYFVSTKMEEINSRQIIESLTEV